MSYLRRILASLLLAIAAAGLCITSALGVLVSETFWLATFVIAALVAIAAAYHHRRSDEREAARLRHPAARVVGQVGMAVAADRLAAWEAIEAAKGPDIPAQRDHNRRVA